MTLSNDQLKNEGFEPTLSNDRLKNERLGLTLSNDWLKNEGFEPRLSNDWLKNEGLEPTLLNDRFKKIKAGTDIVDSSSNFPMIGAQLCLLTLPWAWCQVFGRPALAR
jgi:hypothetical protein